MTFNETVREAEYADIVLSLLSSPYKINSVTKIIFIAFCIKHERKFSSYKNRTKDISDVFFENISVKMMSDYDDIRIMIKILDLLVNTHKIDISADDIVMLEEINHRPINDFLRKYEGKRRNPILEINKLDSIAVIEEVIRYV